MADRGIIFSAPMVRALLDGRKTQTRRLLYSIKNAGTTSMRAQLRATVDGRYAPPRLSYGLFSTLGPWHAAKAGDRLWVREASTFINVQDAGPGKTEICLAYNADGDDLPNRPSIVIDDPKREWHDKAIGWFDRRKRHARFMPRWASRLTLLVESARVERLQEIGEADAIAEGTAYPPSERHADFESRWILGRCSNCAHWDTNLLPNGGERRSCPYHYGAVATSPPYGDAGQGCSTSFRLGDGADETARYQFRQFWDRLHPLEGWRDNPWVVALTFSVRKGNIDA